MNREGDFIQLPYSTRNPIGFTIPTLFYTDGGLLDVPEENSQARADRGPLATLMNIWATDWIHQSLYEEGERYGVSITGVVLMVFGRFRTIFLFVWVLAVLGYVS